MGLCGSMRCGCGIISSDGSVDIAGSGEPGDPFDLSSEGLNLDWSDWTPSWTNLTIGTTGASNTGRWRWMNGQETEVHVRTRLKLGTGFSITAQPYCDTPPGVNAVLAAPQRCLGHCLMLDSDGPDTVGVSQTEGTTDRIYMYGVGLTAVSSTSPFTWVAGDELWMDIIFESTP